MKITFKKEIKSTDKFTNDEIVKLLIKNRHIKNLDEFLNPLSPLSVSLLDFDQKYQQSFKKVLELLKNIKKNDQMIVVYTDYDADGITGGAILWETLYLLGFKVMPYVPHRKLEGYGFSKKGIDNVKKLFNPTLIISVDHGITKVEEIKYAASLGIKIIVTDHHLKGEKIPKKAEAIFHIPALSGSGVAYFFAKEIFLQFKSPTTNYKLLTTNFSSDYLALATIGTIADLVPLTGPSRSVVKHGLQAFKKIKRVGLKQIIKESGIENKDITPYDIGFIIAPRINAIGRLEHAIEALRLLCTTDIKRAEKLAKHIGLTNRERQDLVIEAVEEARLRLKASAGKQKKLSKIIILVSDHWHEGIIGLIASKIAEEFYRPTLVITKSEENYKGSARSIPSFHITEFLHSLKKYIIDVGGHKQAAGFTLEKNQLDLFVTAVRDRSEKLIKDKDLERKIEADLKIPLAKINLSLVKSLEVLEPFGIGNPTPTFYSQGELVDAKLFGKTNNHLKIFIKDNNSFPLELIVFNQADKFKELSRGNLINVVYTLEIDRWNGRERLRGKAIFFISPLD
ncbi:MAG: single-stranded-DNA-specific exonuclease RecJ [Candidatus Roizmanbacteria bacterium]|nr:single-stranded-DNA-specific exonuclease RecJ [Candidatus Roizmanbacteria bacterium]